MAKKKTESVIEEYRRSYPAYEAFALRLKSLLSDLLEVKGTKIHFIESRAKSIESLSEKISRPGKTYSDPLVEIPDLAGIRIVLYYHDDVPKVGKMIRSEFNIIEEEGTHQPEKYSPDHFGYISMHYIISLNEARSKLPEWKPFSTLKAEVQVRTVLQHSWAAVSHALQYKHEGDVPVALRRKLFRLAGLFELADDEFVNIREKRDLIVKETRKAIKERSDTVPIDTSTLLEFINSSEEIKHIIEEMKEIGYTFGAEPRYLSDIAEQCKRIGIKTIGDLKKALNFDSISFFKTVFKGQWNVDIGFTLYLLLIYSKYELFTLTVLEEYKWSPDIAKRVIEGAKATRDV